MNRVISCLCPGCKKEKFLSPTVGICSSCLSNTVVNPLGMRVFKAQEGSHKAGKIGRVIHRPVPKGYHSPTRGGRINSEHGRPGRATEKHCANGHPWTKENTLFSTDGYRRCRECKRASERKQAAMKRRSPNA